MTPSGERPAADQQGATARVVLGLSGALGHDASAALLIDGTVVAAAEEERFTRSKHAKGAMPLAAARFCLDFAGVAASDVQVVAFPFAAIGLRSPARWHYAARHWYAPDRALDALLNGNRRFRRNRRRVRAMCAELGIAGAHVEFEFVEHHLAHAASAYHASGFAGKCAILGVDGKGEYATTFFGYGEHGVIHRIAELYDPDSLSGVYGAMTQYLGFDMLDGEYKVMGMAPYGDPNKFDLSRLIRWDGSEMRVDTRLINTVGLRRYKEQGRGYYFSPALVAWLGPRRQGDEADDPYVDYAAALQQLYETRCLQLIERHLRGVLEETGQLVFAGGGALNVKLNQRILALPYVRSLFVQPAAGDAGTALGAATFAAQRRGVNIAPLRHVFLGPQFTTQQCIAALQAHGHGVHWRRSGDIAGDVARLLHAGHAVAWFQGRMEFGPRALGARSILGCPSTAGSADKINLQIKFRERWRPFCPSVLPATARAMTGSEHPAPYMTITFDVLPEWRARIPEVVHADGTARLQIVDAQTNPRYHALLVAMQALTGNGAVLNTSLNRRGEPIVCTPADALTMFLGCDLAYLALEDVLVGKNAQDLMVCTA